MKILIEIGFIGEEKLMDNTEAILNYVEQELGKVKFGKITIELRDTSDKVDIITENRYRIPKTKNKTKSKID